MAGLFGVILSGIQTAVTERDVLAKVQWDDTVVFFIFGYATR